MVYKEIPPVIQSFMDRITDLCGDTHSKWAVNFNAAFANTVLTTVKQHSDGTTFVLTGDIPAMWLRDSTAQVRPYLCLASEDQELSDMIAGLVKKQFQYVCIDPYANAFNESENSAGHQDDETEMSGWIWERKYEIDSLCYPIQLAYLLYKNTGRVDHFDESFKQGVKKAIDVFQVEQDHEHSPYSFIRHTDRQEDTLPFDGKGTPVSKTGMTWSGFRPSDDACMYGYLVPSNMFAVVVLDYIQFIFSEISPDDQIVIQAQQLRKEIQEGIDRYGRTKNQAGDIIYAYEVDGNGHATVMDDSNVPNLISAPYLGYGTCEDPIYQSTRKTVLSKENPYFYEGMYASGIGSSHTPENFVWPIAMAMTGLTTTDKEKKARILDQLVAIDAGSHLMHEGINVDDPNDYTREWFSWANMMFCELVMDYFDIRVKK
ncbi:hypothetical protein A5886_002561 [Enterococcus sp. 8G7_MSG3316]|uniref:Metal-independent alpha-mannosidase n=1 Tax=Candidatus Enterococcus testudinis TaxID=1834191 RepID=A0A242A9R2_9ENTE|nr:glycoside hydrolase family 125 protein [Enterococcus sp. 8G7_MSG3316]OTN77461.1 hypothetical protein A5886_002561 [Enterococcus sp. 8G7_MSG3316]